MRRIGASPREQQPSTRESIIDRRIREAIEAGVFDELPFQGQPLPIEDDSAAGSWGPAYRMLRNAGMAPPWIEADKDVRRLLERIEGAIALEALAGGPGRARRRQELARVVDAANAAIARLNVEAPTDQQHRRPVDAVDTLSRFDASEP